MRSLFVLPLLLIAGCGDSRAGAGSDSAMQSVVRADTIVLAPRAEVDVRFHIDGKLPPDFAARVAANDTMDSPGLTAYADRGVQFRGGFAIADGYRLLFVDSSHHIVKRVGQKGRGPGEFDGVAALCVTRGDTVVAVDERLTVVDAKGAVVRQFSPQPAHPALEAGCFEDATYLAIRTPHRDSLRYERYDLHGKLRNVVATVQTNIEKGGFEIMAGPVSFVSGQHVYLADPWSPNVLMYDANGTLDRIYRLSDAPVPRKSTGTYTPFVAPKLGNTNPAFRPMPAKTDSWPYHAAIRVGTNGELWLRDYPPVASLTKATAVAWTGYESNGTPIGRLTVDSVASAEERVKVVGFGSGTVIVRYESEQGPAEYRTVSLADLVVKAKR
jgi:hypothetical protein